MITQTYKLDIVPNGIKQVVDIHESDAGIRQITFQLYSSQGTSISFPAGAVAYVEGMKFSGAAYSYSATLSGTNVTFTVTPQMAAEEGGHDAQIKIMKDEDIICAANFTFWVQRDVLDGAELSDTEVPGLVTQMEALLDGAEDAVTQYPKIGDNNNWYVWDATQDDWVDTNVPATGTSAVQSVNGRTGAVTGLAEDDGAYPDMTVGNFITDMGMTDKVPYNFRKTVDYNTERERDKIVGGTVVWNQLVQPRSSTTSRGIIVTGTDTGATLSGTADSTGSLNVANAFNTVTDHVYVIAERGSALGVTGAEPYTNIGGSDTFSGTATIKKESSGSSRGVTIRVEQGTVFSGESIDCNCFDLTAMFGSTIADYLYTLESGTAGAGISKLKSWGFLDKDYYAYSANTLKSVEGLSKHRMVGFNAYNNGTAKLLGGVQYQITGTYSSLSYSTGETITPDANGKFSPMANGTLTVTGGGADTCVHLVWDGERDGEYEPYVEHEYALDSDLTLRGIPKLDASNNLYYDGDTYEADGTVTRRYGIVDLGTLSWTYNSGYLYFYADVLTMANNGNGITNKYANTTAALGGNQEDKTIKLSTTGNHRVFITDKAYTNAASFKTAMSGQYLIYELQPSAYTTESADPFSDPQWVDDWGTEEYVSTSLIPIGHETFYEVNLKSKLEMSPESPSGDGEYILKQENGINNYIPLAVPNKLPTAPTTDGTYTLQVTVSGGVATYSWV